MTTHPFERQTVYMLNLLLLGIRAWREGGCGTSGGWRGPPPTREPRTFCDHVGPAPARSWRGIRRRRAADITVIVRKSAERDGVATGLAALLPFVSFQTHLGGERAVCAFVVLPYCPNDSRYSITTRAVTKMN